MSLVDPGIPDSLKFSTVNQVMSDSPTGFVDGPIDFRAESAAATAAKFAGSVDAEARFPHEGMEALRQQRLLGVMVPRSFGGEGASVSDVAQICYQVARGCASTAMIFGMHQIAVACVARHGAASAWHREMLRRLCDQQLLLASSTTEGGSGGNVRSSAAAVDNDGERIALVREATVISYGAQADAIVTTARRSADAAASDQVLVTFLKQDFALEPLLAWDTLGMRGTCSAGFSLKAAGVAAQILPEKYERIHAQTMVPVSHCIWASVWAGIAASAIDRTRAFVRAAARRANGQLPPAAAHLTKASASLQSLIGLISFSLRAYEQAAEDKDALAALEFQAMVNLTKVEASEAAVSIVMSCMRACGLEGYRNDGQYSLGRHLRDVLSSPIMISNDRILANIGTAALMSSTPDSLLDTSRMAA